MRLFRNWLLLFFAIFSGQAENPLIKLFFRNFICQRLQQRLMLLITDETVADMKDGILETIMNCKIPVVATEISSRNETSNHSSYTSSESAIPLLLQYSRRNEDLNVIGVFGHEEKLRGFLQSVGRTASVCSPRIHWLILFRKRNNTKSISLSEYIPKQCNVIFGIASTKRVRLYYLDFVYDKWQVYGRNKMVPFGSWSNNTSPNSLKWPKSFLSNDLNGRHLKVAMEKHFPFFIPGMPADGLDIRILDALKLALNFSYELVEPSDGKWGSKRNGVWTGMIGMLYRNEADLAMSGMSISHVRMEAADFSFPYLFDYVTFVVRSPSELPRTWVITRPFGMKVWIGILSALIVVSFILYLVETACQTLCVPSGYVHFPNPKILSHRVSFATAFWFTFSASVNQGAFPASRTPSRVIVGFWLLSVLTLLAGYSGILVSKLTTPTLEDPIDTIPELVSAIKNGKMTCGTIRDSSDHAIFKDSDYPPFEIILNSMESDPNNFVSHDKEGLVKVLEEEPIRYAYIAGRITTEADMPKPHLYHFGRDVFLMSGYGIAFSKEFWYQEQFNTVLLRLMQSGLISEWLADILDGIRQDDMTNVPTERPLNIEEFQGVFLLLLLGYITSLLIFLCQVCWKALFRNKSHKKGKDRFQKATSISTH